MVKENAPLFKPLVCRDYTIYDYFTFTTRYAKIDKYVTIL